MTPRATYRVQFHADFTFADAQRLAPYWAKLGVSHVYASPIATARKGSIHGYDVVDPTTINPALGGGALLDLGVYVVSLAQYFLGDPAAVVAHGSLFPTGVDAEAGLPVRAQTPVPGGVGPLTSALMYQNLVRAVKLQRGESVE